MVRHRPILADFDERMGSQAPLNTNAQSMRQQHVFRLTE